MSKELKLVRKIYEVGDYFVTVERGGGVNVRNKAQDEEGHPVTIVNNYFESMAAKGTFCYGDAVLELMEGVLQVMRDHKEGF